LLLLTLSRRVVVPFNLRINEVVVPFGLPTDEVVVPFTVAELKVGGSEVQ
jgi:hypothetical protein